MERKSFIFHREWFEALNRLPKEFKADVYEGIVEYALTGKLSVDLKPVAAMALELVKPRVDAEREYWFETCQKRKEASLKGVEARKTRKIGNQTQPNGYQTSSSGNQTVHDNDNDNDKKETVSNDTAKKRPVVSEDLIRYGERIAISEAAHRKLELEYGPGFVAEQIAIADDWLLSNGKTQKDYAAFLRNWLRRASATARLNTQSDFSQKRQNTPILSRETASESNESDAFRAFFDAYPATRRKQRDECWVKWQEANLDAKPNLAANFAEFVNVGGIAYSALNLLSMLTSPDAATQVRFNEAMRDKREYYNEQIRSLRETATVATRDDVERQIDDIRHERNHQYPYL